MTLARLPLERISIHGSRPVKHRKLGAELTVSAIGIGCLGVLCRHSTKRVAGMRYNGDGRRLVNG
jgi:hypothetical protein